VEVKGPSGVPFLGPFGHSSGPSGHSLDPLLSSFGRLLVSAGLLLGPSDSCGWILITNREDK
jgi:hypothetical protein